MQAAASEGVWRCHTARRWGTVGKAPAHAGRVSPDSSEPAHPMGVAYAGILVSGPMQGMPAGPFHSGSPSLHDCGPDLGQCSGGKLAQSPRLCASQGGSSGACPRFEAALPLSMSISNMPQHCCSHVGLAEWDAPTRHLYISRHKAGLRLQCPCCARGRIVPVVYGFPSGPLLKAGKQRRVLNGGDYLIASEPVWACNACSARYAAFPFQDIFD